MIVRPEGAGRAIVSALTREQAGAVVLFGADWCADCRRATAWLTSHDVPFSAIDTDADPAERERAAVIAGRSNIPVLVAPDGTVLVEPSDLELADALTRYQPSHDNECHQS